MWKVVSRADDETGRTSYSRKQIALEVAQAVCDKEGRSADVFDGRGKLRYRYWRDAVGLQSLEY